MQVREGAFRARTRIRDKDGVTREVTATGTTKAAAERALREKLVERATPTRQALTADTTVAKLASLWLKYLRDEGRLEVTTINEYERVLTKVVVPELGGLRLREVTTSRLDLFLVRLRAVSASRQRKTKVVIGAMLGMAVRHDALAVNPVQQTSRIHRPRFETRADLPKHLVAAQRLALALDPESGRVTEYLGNKISAELSREATARTLLIASPTRPSG